MSGEASEPPLLLVVGSVNADLVVRVPRHARPGETVLGGDLAVHSGGKGANQAVAAARLGGHVAFAGRVGGDAYGPMLLDGLRAEGVDTSFVATDDGPTGVALITVDADGENAITVAPGANGRFTPAHVAALEPALRRARVVSLQLEIPHATVAEVMRRSADAGTRVVLNPSPGPWTLSAHALRVCDPLVLNEHEAASGVLPTEAAATPPHTEEDVPAEPLERAHRAVLALRATGAEPRSVVVTLGAAGAVCAEDGGELVYVPAPSVRAVDTTGAGDAFTGALAWRLALGDPLADAVGYAVRVGAAAVTAEGAQASYPTDANLPPA